MESTSTLIKGKLIRGLKRRYRPLSHAELDGAKCAHILNKINGNLFLPLKAEMRKKIGKGEGDWVHVILYADNSPIVIPEEFLVCLLDAPRAYAFFKTLTESAQKHFIDWIYEAKRLETKVNRISKTIERLEKGLKMYDVDESE